MRRILLVTPYYYPNIEWGGPVSFVFNLAIALKRKGFYVEILTTDISLSRRQVKEKIKKVRGVKVYFCRSLFPFLAIKYRIFLSLEQILVGLKIIRNFDIVHFHDTFILQNTLLSFWCRLFGVPYCITPHGSLNLSPTRGKIFFKKIFINLFDRAYFKQSFGIHAVAEKEAQMISYFFPYLKKKIRVIHPFLIREKYRLIEIRKRYNIPPDDLLLLFLGRIDLLKGVKELVAGFLRYCEKYGGGSTLVLAGPDAGAMAGIKKLVNGNKFKDKLIYAGLVKGNLKDSLLEQSDVLVLLSRSEGFSYSVLEALSYGKALLCSRESNAEVAVKAGCGLITSRKKEEIADKIRTFKDRQFLEKCKQSSRKLFKERFDLEKILSKFIAFYEQGYAKREKSAYHKLG